MFTKMKSWLSNRRKRKEQAIRSMYAMLLETHCTAFKDMPDIVHVLANVQMTVQNLFDRKTRPVALLSLRTRVLRIRDNAKIGAGQLKFGKQPATPDNHTAPVGLPRWYADSAAQAVCAAAEQHFASRPQGDPSYDFLARSALMRAMGLCDTNLAGFMFSPLQKVRHLKSGKLYEIVGLPSHYHIEATGEPAYAYMPVGESQPMIWVRSQTEMEDGRFVPYKNDPQNSSPI